MSRRFFFLCVFVVGFGAAAGMITASYSIWIKIVKSGNPRPMPTQSPVTILPTKSPENEIPVWTLLVTGDIIPARVTNQRMVQKQDFFWPVASIAATLRDADITLSNLESPLLSTCPVTNEGFTFCGDARFSGALSDSGIDVVNLANNHSQNFGWEGIAETEQHLRDHHIASTGFTAAEGTVDGLTCAKDTFCSGGAVLVTHGIRVGFLGYNAVGQILHPDVIQKQIQSLRKQVDVIILSVHWGKEYSHEPIADASLAPDDPKQWGKKFIDWGADVVVGNHPHWYQNVEWYSGKPIFYAMGNTVFDQEWSEETKRGYLAKLTFHGTEVSPEGLTYIPIGIRDWGQAYLLEGGEREKILQFLQKS